MARWIHSTTTVNTTQTKKTHGSSSFTKKNKKNGGRGLLGKKEKSSRSEERGHKAFLSLHKQQQPPLFRSSPLDSKTTKVDPPSSSLSLKRNPPPSSSTSFVSRIRFHPPKKKNVDQGGGVLRGTVGQGPSPPSSTNPFDRPVHHLKFPASLPPKKTTPPSSSSWMGTSSTKNLKRKSLNEPSGPGVTKDQSVKERQRVLMTELNNEKKQGQFIDRRIGEFNVNLTESEKYQLRWTKAKQVQHRRSLHPLSLNPETTSTLSSKDRYLDMIRESKHRKLEKQMTLKSLMEKKDVLDDLYSTWFTSVPLRSKPSSSSSLFQDDLPPEIHSSSPSSPRLRQEDPDPPHPATEPRHDWDALYRTYLNQVKNTLPLHVHEEHGQENEEIGGVTLLRRRCMPLQRVKSEKEQWVEEKWKLEVLENERKQRMVGEQDHDDDDDDDDDDDEEDIDVEDEEDDEEEEEEIDVEEQEEEEEEEVDVEEDDDNEERETNEVKRNPPLHLVPSNEPSSPLAPSMTCIKETSMDHLHPEKDHDHDHEVPDAFQPPTTFAEWIQWVQGRSLTSMQVWLTQLTMWSLSEKHSRRTQYLKTLMWVFMAFHDSKPTGPVPKKKEEPLLPNDDHPDEDDPLGSSTSSAPPTWVLPVSEVQAWWSVLVPYFVQLVSDDESHVERFLPWLHQTYFSTPSSTCLFTHPSSQVWTGPHLLTLDFVFTVYSSTDFHHPILTPLTYQVTHSLAHLDVVHFPHALHHGLHFVALLIDFHVPHKWVPEVVNFLTQCLCLPISIQEHEHEHEHEHERKHKQAPTLQDLEWGSSPRDSLTQHASHSSSREAFNWLYSTSSSTSWYGGGVQPLPTALRSSLLSLKSQDDPPPPSPTLPHASQESRVEVSPSHPFNTMTSIDRSHPSVSSFTMVSYLPSIVRSVTHWVTLLTTSSPSWSSSSSSSSSSMSSVASLFFPLWSSLLLSWPVSFIPSPLLQDYQTLLHLLLHPPFFSSTTTTTTTTTTTMKEKKPTTPSFVRPRPRSIPQLDPSLSSTSTPSTTTLTSMLRRQVHQATKKAMHALRLDGQVLDQLKSKQQHHARQLYQAKMKHVEGTLANALKKEQGMEK